MATTPEEAQQAQHGPLLPLVVGALGVVYGDIGTSPLYAARECFNGPHGVAVNPENVLGVMSLFFWALTLVVTVKYLVFILRADNQGEGGILALLALTLPRSSGQRTTTVVLVGMFGAALLYSDGMLTPAISVLSAIEGLEVLAPELELFVLPVSAVVLVALFLFQARGTGRVGAVFGPFIILWFATLALMGLPWIARHPEVLAAVNPLHAVRLFASGQADVWILGSVVLCVTGAEALYADMGHFGRRPIRLAWNGLVFPALLLNYFGQGALLLADPRAAVSPFYAMVPRALILPVLVIATGASVIASQALISGAFSLTRQATQLGYMPRVAIVHTSTTERGQIYAPGVNWMLMVACLALVASFRSSSNLAGVYGLAMIGTMAITAVLFYRVAQAWWGKTRAALLCGAFLVVDLSFLVGALQKLTTGGWVPLVIASGILGVMSTWSRGRKLLAATLRSKSEPFDQFVDEVRKSGAPRVPGTAVFMTSSPTDIPPVLLHHLRHSHVLHQQIVLLSIGTAAVPRLRRSRIATVQKLGHGFFRVQATYGFIQTPRVTEVLRLCEKHGLHTTPETTSFFLGREKLVVTPRPGMHRLRKSLFVFLSRNARPATDFFRIPPDRVVEIGLQVEL